MFRVFIFSIFVLFTQSLVAEIDGSAILEKAVEGAFGEAERQIIKEYFGDYNKVDAESSGSSKNKKSKKEKKSKQKALPPGIAKKLKRGGTLPPGIAKRELPNDLKQKLPAAPEGYERVIIENDVFSVDVNTGKIVDIIKGVLIN